MNQSIIKALGLLEFFSEEKPELSLKEITDKANLPKPTVYRLLSSLEFCGFLTRCKNTEYDTRYKLGLKLMELGQLVSEQLELRKVALPQMKKLADEINEVVHLVILNQHEAIYIEKVESTRALRLHTRVGKTSPLHLGSGPKLLFAFLSDERRQDIFKENLLKKLSTSERESLIEQLKIIRDKGYAVSFGEQDAGTTGVSYPIYDFHGTVIAALAVSGPSSRFEGVQLKQIKDSTQKTAASVSYSLGFKRNE
jgi:DNA-binding IclR family transcriptional regulator